jgi:DNA polymerase III subunit gamma/tau
VPVEDAVLPLVVRAGAGSVRDSLSVLDQLLAGSDESGLSYDRAVALLGYTDASLLDEIVHAFATADGAAVFGVVNRIIDGGHEPRRFAADMLDRFRDLIILAAVPDAAEIGLLDLAPDRAERMAAQAGRFGQAGLTRAAEIVSAGLDQMRGATSPRLLLELMCAQVLLPAAATDEKSLLARLERLESAGRGTPAPPPPSPARPPQSGTSDYPERTGVAPAAERTSAPLGEPTRAVEATEPDDAPPATPPATGSASADSLRQNWSAVLDAVKRERRVAWIVLSNASVQSLEDGVLTLRFARDGELKGFTTSGCDADLKRVLSTGFGLNVMIRGVTGADPASAGTRSSRPPAAARSGAPRRHDELPSGEMPSNDPDEPADDQASGEAELTGMDLIQRELGGQVISEIED